MGDFSGYLNASGELIKKVDKYKDDWTKEELNEYKTAIYDNISANMFEYDPEQTREIADRTLEDLQNSDDTENFIDLCSKMMQGALNQGEYLYALNLIHKLLSAMDEASIDPLAENFDIRYLLMTMIHVKVLFGTGSLNECVDIGYNILNVLDGDRLNDMDYTLVSRENFEDMICDFVAYMAMADAFTMREDVNELLDIVNRLFDFIPKSYDIFVKLQNFIMGEKVSVSESDKGQDAFSNILYYIMNAFTNYNNNPENLAKEIYKSKIVAKESSVYPFELFADLIIGYSYTELKSYYKARAILNEVLDTANEKGLTGIKYIAFYVMSHYYMKQGRFDIAYAMLNNSSIQMERAGGFSDYLMLLNKFQMYKLMSCLKVYDKADICLSQAEYIVEKYGLIFNLDVDIDKFIEENQIEVPDMQSIRTDLDDEEYSEEENSDGYEDDNQN